MDYDVEFEESGVTGVAEYPEWVEPSAEPDERLPKLSRRYAKAFGVPLTVQARLMVAVPLIDSPAPELTAQYWDDCFSAGMRIADAYRLAGRFEVDRRNAVAHAVENLFTPERAQMAPYMTMCGLAMLPLYTQSGTCKTVVIEAFVDSLKGVFCSDADSSEIMRLIVSLLYLKTEAQRRFALARINNLLTSGAVQA